MTADLASIAAFALAESYKRQRDALTFTPAECALLIDALDLLMFDSLTDTELAHDGDALLDLRNRFTRARKTAETPGLPTVRFLGLAVPPT